MARNHYTAEEFNHIHTVLFTCLVLTKWKHREMATFMGCAASTVSSFLNGASSTKQVGKTPRNEASIKALEWLSRYINKGMANEENPLNPRLLNPAEMHKALPAKLREALKEEGWRRPRTKKVDAPPATAPVDQPPPEAEPAMGASEPPTTQLVLSQVDVHGMPIHAVETGENQYEVTISSVCDVLGIKAQDQVDKLRTRSWSQKHLRQSPVRFPSGATKHDVWMLNVDVLMMWLATINENNVEEEKRPGLILLQSECARVLYAYFAKGAAVNAKRFTAEEIRVEVGAQMAAVLSPVVTLLEKHSKAFERVDQQLAQWEERERGTLRIIAAGPNTQVVAEALYARYGKAGPIRPGSELRYKPIKNKHVLLLASRAGVHLDKLRVSTERGPGKEVLDWNEPAVQAISAHVVWWYHLGCPKMQGCAWNYNKDGVGQKRYAACYDWDDKELVPLLRAMGVSESDMYATLLNVHNQLPPARRDETYAPPPNVSPPAGEPSAAVGV